MGRCKIAIIGGGPKGMYGFERLAAWFAVNPPVEQTEIHMYNRSASFGAGENYRVSQPDWLLMNNPISDVNMWSEDIPKPVVPHPRSFTEWLREHTGGIISGTDYVSRATAGAYLKDGVNQIAANLPEKVTATFIVGEVVDVHKVGTEYAVHMRETGIASYTQPNHLYTHILLATGHSGHDTTKKPFNRDTVEHEGRNDRYIYGIYPVETMFSKVNPNCRVGIKGLGLTFVDTVLALTEGKGGCFIRDKNTDTLRYVKSGNEPKVIYPFSRSGLPMIPRISVPNVNQELKFFTKSAFQNIRSGKKLLVDKDIWPLLRQDMIWSYYKVVFEHSGYRKRLKRCVDFEEMEHLIAHYHEEYPLEVRFVPELFLDPATKSRNSGVSYHRFILTLYGFYLQEARKGEVRSPWAAVAAVWRKASGLFCELYAFGGLTPESHREFDRTLRGKLTRITFGPPVKSAEKINALMQAGILQFHVATNPELLFDEKSGQMLLESVSCSKRYAIDYLVDARIPKMTMDNEEGSLFQNMMNRGLITRFENTFGGDTYKTGSVNISRQGFAIDKSGRVRRGIAVTGTPTEGITFDNDTLSRERNNFVDGWAACISRQYAQSSAGEYVY